MSAGTQRGASAVATDGTLIYVAGGYRGGSVADVSVYDTVNDVWTALPALPAARDHLVGTFVGGRVFVIGGRQGGVLTDRADVLAVTTGDWTSGAAMPTARAGCASALLDGRIYIFGGEGNDANGAGIFNEAESYDVAANGWRVHTAMRTPRHGMGAATANGVIYVPGGGTREGFAVVGVHESFEP